MKRTQATSERVGRGVPPRTEQKRRPEWFRRLADLSIRNKLILFGTTTATLSLLLSSVIFVSYYVSAVRKEMIYEFSSLAGVLASNLSASVVFDDPVTAQEILSSLKQEPSIHCATVFRPDGTVFARYNGPGVSSGCSTVLAPDNGCVFDGPIMHVTVPVREADETIARLQLCVSTRRLTGNMKAYAWTVALVVVLSVVFSAVLAMYAQKMISSPILQLARTAQYISETQDFSVRLTAPSRDEVGELYDAFNHLLTEIETAQKALQESYEQLEDRIVERTYQLMEANEELRHEIAERERTERKLRELQDELVRTAHEAGMAEIATSVLHNVGNVLNSVNVASNLAAEKVRQLGVRDMLRVKDLLLQHQQDLADFLTKDQRGKHLIPFLIELANFMAKQEREVINHLDSLQKHIDHIKQIIRVQQSHARAGGLVQETSLAELIDDAIQINQASIDREQIEIVREYESLPPVLVDKQKVMQILVNLISNAKHALRDSGRPDKRLTVRLRRVGENRVQIQVEDNGVGISPENLTRIFGHGFTTKKDGHGFGLHSAALHAKEMGGSLTAHSEGPGKGAVFTLEMPVRWAATGNQVVGSGERGDRDAEQVRAASGPRSSGN